MPSQKDYYQILEVDSAATPEQIKEAFRAAAKKYHPDVVGGSSPDANKFRDIQEAYAVLSVLQSRVNYDLLRKKDPDQFTGLSQHEFDKKFNVSARGADGNVPVSAPKPGSYAETRLAELAAERKKYNVNHIGFYNGGVPTKGRGAIRGSALGRPGEFHTPQWHNFLEGEHPDKRVINSEDAVKFKAYMLSDKDAFTMSRPSHPMYYDRNMDFVKDRNFWLGLLLSMAVSVWAYRRWCIETLRWQRWDRMENLEKMPAHHFNNRGGVLVKKQFGGFEKYHKNNGELMEWYKKAFPTIVKEQQ